MKELCQGERGSDYKKKKKIDVFCRISLFHSVFSTLGQGLSPKEQAAVWMHGEKQKGKQGSKFPVTFSVHKYVKRVANHRVGRLYKKGSVACMPGT